MFYTETILAKNYYCFKLENIIPSSEPSFSTVLPIVTIHVFIKEHPRRLGHGIKEIDFPKLLSSLENPL